MKINIQTAQFVEWFHTLNHGEQARVIRDRVAGKTIDRSQYGKPKARLLRGGRPNWLAPDAIVRAELIQRSRSHSNWR